MTVLYISPHNIIGSANSGGVQCARRNYDLLCRIYGEENVFSILFPEEMPAQYPARTQCFPHTRNLWEALVAALQNCKIYLKKHEPAVISAISTIDPGLIFFDSSLLGRLAGKIPEKSKQVLFLHNIEQLYAKNKVLHQGPQFLPSFLASKSNETTAIRHADAVICLNERDATLLQKLYGTTADMLLPISFADCFDQTKITNDAPKRELLFIGSNFPPNLDGIKWFIREVLPLLPGYRLNIVGKGFEDERTALQSEAVTVTGTVDDLASYYYRYPGLVMPIQYGDGMKVKTAEAMMYGRTIFATDEALEGYDADGVEGIYRCNTAAEFAAAITAFYDTSTPAPYREAVRRLFLEKYETSRQYDAFAAVLQEKITD